jgi:hypothetical protein
MARAKALRWWQERGGGTPPRTVEEALPLAWKLPRPVSISVDETNKYPEIVAHAFERTGVDAGSEGSSDRGPARGAGADAVPALPGVPGWLVQAVEAGSARKRAA